MSCIGYITCVRTASLQHPGIMVHIYPETTWQCDASLPRQRSIFDHLECFPNGREVGTRLDVEGNTVALLPAAQIALAAWQ
jgi:hypothetical protein